MAHVRHLMDLARLVWALPHLVEQSLLHERRIEALERGQRNTRAIVSEFYVDGKVQQP